MLSVTVKLNFYCVSACLIAILFSEVYASEVSIPRRILDVDYLWQGSVPVEYEYADNEGGVCRKDGETALLIPYSVSSNGPLKIELYGCWQPENTVACGSGGFKEAQITKSDENKAVISLLQKDELVLICLAIYPWFDKIDTFEINGTWQPGEVEIIVRNSTGDLTGYVTVE